MIVQHREPDVGGGNVCSVRSAKPNRICSAKMSKTADFDTLLFHIRYVCVWYVGGYTQEGGRGNAPLNKTLYDYIHD